MDMPSWYYEKQFFETQAKREGLELEEFYKKYHLEEFYNKHYKHGEELTK